MTDTFLLINYETFNPILKHKQEKKIVTRLKINQKISAMFEISIKYYIYTYNVDKHEAIHTLSNDLGNSTSPFSQKKKKKKKTQTKCARFDSFDIKLCSTVSWL